MDRTPRVRQDASDRGPAAETKPRAARPQFADLRPSSAAHAGLQRMIEAGPRMTAQRKTVSGAGQRKSGKAEDSGLPAALRSGVEALSGVAMDGVQVHYNSGKPAQLNALAYAQGREIHVAPGQEAHLPHEAWHIAQQAQGRVRPTTQMSGEPVNDDRALEDEADQMGARALQTGATKQARDSDA